MPVRTVLALLAVPALLLAGCPVEPSDTCRQYIACQTEYDEAAQTGPTEFSDYEDDGVCWDSAENAALCTERCQAAIEALREAATTPASMRRRAPLPNEVSDRLSGRRTPAILRRMSSLRFIALPVAAIAIVTGCVPIERNAACVAAQKCDEALERPFGDFDETDPVFGDDLNGDGTKGDAGTCWANNEAAVPCIAACEDFLAEQIAIAEAQNNDAVILACGGAVEEE